MSRTPKHDGALVEVENLDELEAQERSLSAARRRLQELIDFMRPQNPAQRTPQGEQLRYLELKEKELSTRRRTLHRLIDSLRRRGGA